MNLEEATDVFCSSFAFIRSLTHPYEFVRHGDLRILRDATVRREPRGQEIVIVGAEPEEALKQVIGYDPPRHFLCVVTLDSEIEEFKKCYKSGGYRLMSSEFFFVRDLTLPIEPASVEIRQVTTVADAERVRRAARTTQLPLKHLDGTRMRLYAAWDGDQPMGWVRSIHLQKDATWASNLFVPERYRRQGVGTSLMNAMLKDDQTLGAKDAVLFASHVGSKLYPQLGYKQVAVVLLFAKQRQR